ncbi:hypothetical protein BD779DRAFT_564936 [Infundibulicybe gibba]|nr:hypothetical protein BD779DRAFT_564936 [Infundibulicybe gibba]
MADAAKRKTRDQDSGRRKKKYRSDGTPVWGKRLIDGPGVWISCVKGKEKQTVGEIYDLFESLANELWPSALGSELSDIDSEQEDVNIEDQIANEVSAITRKQPTAERKFQNCQTNTPCVVFISCKPPIDPVELVVKHINNVLHTGVARTRYTHRLVPVSGSCVANVQEIEALCRATFTSFISLHPDKYRYKIELRVRNHTTIPRPTLIQAIARCIPEGHKVDLTDPEIFILVEVFKSVCGIGIVRDYYKLQKFNVMEIANIKNSTTAFGESRVNSGPDSDETANVPQETNTII